MMKRIKVNGKKLLTRSEKSSIHKFTAGASHLAVDGHREARMPTTLGKANEIWVPCGKDLRVCKV